MAGESGGGSAVRDGEWACCEALDPVGMERNTTHTVEVNASNYKILSPSDWRKLFAALAGHLCNSILQKWWMQSEDYVRTGWKCKGEKFIKFVENSWKLPVKGTPMKVLYIKLKRSKIVLKEFNNTHFGGITIKVSDKRKELEDVQKNILSDDMRRNIAELVEKDHQISAELKQL
ncbi:hypothetical protein DITRI_Ditri19aG0133400 [Diplodiscus trichospermus]